MEREPNTEYVLSLSYGKDSCACIGAIEKLGLPLDRIIHAEVWATDTIPADLPPMVEFKAKADEIIYKRTGIKVEHLCAKIGGGLRTYERMFYHVGDGKYGEQIYGFPCQIKPWCNSKLKCECVSETNLRRYILSTIEESFGGGTVFRQELPRGARGRSNRVCSTKNHGLCNEVESILHRRTQTERIYGFPIVKGNWCTSALKQRVFE